MKNVSHHLLRTLAAVPVDHSVLLLGCGDGRHAEALLRLGFPVHACDPDADCIAATRERLLDLVGEETTEQCTRVAGLDALNYIDETFNWVVAHRAERIAPKNDDLTRLLTEMRRLVTPGGWVYVTLPAHPDDVEAQDRTAGDGAPPEDAPLDPEDVSAERGVRIDALETARTEAGLATSVPPEIVDDLGDVRLRAIFRFVE